MRRTISTAAVALVAAALFSTPVSAQAKGPPAAAGSVTVARGGNANVSRRAPATSAPATVSREVVRAGSDDPRAAEMAAYITRFYGAQASHTEALYVGSEMCLACHSGPNPVHGYDTSGWRSSFHARPFKTVDDDRFSMVKGMGIVVDSNRNGIDDFKDGLDFNDPDQTTFEAYKPNAPVLGYSDATGYTMTIGPISYRIFFTWGGNGIYKQRFVVRLPVTDRPNGLSAGKYVSPLQYNEKTHEWVPYHPEHWWNEDGSVAFTTVPDSPAVAARARSFDQRCSGCHFTGTTIFKDAMGEWVSAAAPTVLIDPDDPTYFDMNDDGIREETHIGCESCHGPGSLHIMGHGDPDLIVKPADDFTAEQANNACGGCHVRGKSSNKTYGFLWDEVEDHGYITGEPLDDYFSPSPGLWPDGQTPKQHHQQWHDLNASIKPEEHVTCYNCHDLHNTTKHNIREFIDQTTASGVVRIETENDDNTLCLACHAGDDDFAAISKEMVADYDANVVEIGAVVSAHSHHPYAPDRKLGLSRCSKCHMPKTAKSAINYDIHSHTFEPIPPEKTLMYQAEGGMPNSCATSCHRNIVDVFPNSVDGDIGKWTEESDVTLAEWLMGYFGPNGKWWKHSVEE